MVLRLFALGDVDIDAYDSLWPSIVAIHNEASRLDPAHLTSAADHPVFKTVFAPSLPKGLGSKLLDPFQIFREDPGVPFATRGHFGALRKSMDGHVALRNLHGIGIDIVGIATHQRSLTGEGQLQIALGQSVLCPLEVSDVATDP